MDQAKPPPCDLTERPAKASYVRDDHTNPTGHRAGSVHAMVKPFDEIGVAHGMQRVSIVRQLAGVSMAEPQKKMTRRSKGFRKTSGLVEQRIRAAGESRGFAVTRLITGWSSVVGSDIAAVCEPVKVSYAKGGLGGTLTVLTTGAQAPMLEMQTELIRQKVNACYGYNAIARVRLTQTAPSGFGSSREKQSNAPVVSDASVEKARVATADIKDQTLREVLESFGANVISQGK